MNTFQTTLTSPRFSRLLFWLGVAVLAAGILALGSRFVGGSDPTPTAAAPDFTPKLPENSVPLKNSQGVTVKKFEQLDPHFRATIRTFLATAVRRENLAQSWNIVAPSMKSGYTRQQWANAKALPVVPYPVADLDKVTYSLHYALKDDVLVDVGVFAKPEADLRPLTFRIGLIPVGKGAKKRWVVNYWMPRWSPVVPLN
jgi:hypothetical protein